jgi:hypothetical protein
MTVRASRRLAWSLCALAIASAVGVVVLDVLDRTRIHSLHDAQPGGVVLAVSFSLLGATIVSRRGGNRIGWIYLLIGVLMPWQALAVLYYERSGGTVLRSSRSTACRLVGEEAESAHRACVLRRSSRLSM